MFPALELRLLVVLMVLLENDALRTPSWGELEDILLPTLCCFFVVMNSPLFPTEQSALLHAEI